MGRVLLPSAQVGSAPCEGIRLYADGAGPFRNSLEQSWMYIGLLAIPEARHGAALQILQKARDEAGYQREVHFADLRNRTEAPNYGEKTRLASMWVDRLLWDDRKTFHFHLLGLELTKLQARAFGCGNEYKGNAYNRFFRSSVAYLLKAFFPAEDTVVVSVFHDKDPLEQHELFQWHVMWRLGRDKQGVRFLTDHIHFIDSDHTLEPEYSEESHFIQLCDVLLGGFIQCLDARNKKGGCSEVGEHLLPLLERLTDPERCRNPNSRYRYVGRVAVSFFPSRSLTEKELEDPLAKELSCFYVCRPLLLHDRLSGQQRLF